MVNTDELVKIFLESTSNYTIIWADLHNSRIINLLEKASNDPFLGDFIYSKKLQDTQVFCVNGTPVGFIIPRVDSDGRARSGPVFIDPLYRKKGYAEKFLSQFFKDKKGRAFIEPNNLASQRTFSKVGFKQSEKILKSSDGTFYEYLKD